MKVIITGGCGFLGANVAAKLLSKKIPILILDNLSRESSGNNLEWLKTKGNFNFERCDVRDYEKCVKIFKYFRPDVIFHFAGQVAMTTSILKPKEDFEINTLGTINLLEACRIVSPNCIFIYSSTNKVYGDLNNIVLIEGEKRFIAVDYPMGIPESVPLNFHSPYGCSKGSAEQYVLDYGRIYGINSVVFRHSSMYGSRQYATPDQGWIGWFCKEAIRQSFDDKAIQISGSGKQVRDVLFCDDMVSLYIMAAENSGKISGEAYNIGGGITNSLSLIELFEQLGNMLGRSITYKSGIPRISDQLFFVADLAKIQSKIAWKPKVTKEVGLKLMLQWVAESTHN